jgi:hypothetical protein
MKRHHAPLLLFILLLASCSNSPKAEVAKEPEKPPEPVTGRYAFHQVFINARTWATDMQGLRVANLRVGTETPPPGKSYAWEITLVSPSKGKQRVYTYSVIEAEGNIHKGVFGNVEENYMQRGQARLWNIQALKTDSDAAYEAALKKSADYVKKNPDKPLTFLLEQTPRHPNLAWRVIWGPSVSASNYSVYVDASTGLYMETMR